MTDISVSGNSPPSVSVSGSTVSVSVSSGVGPQGPAGKDGAGGVATLNGLTGTLTIASAGGVTASGSTITIGGGGGASSWDDLTGKPDLVYSVAGRTGTVTLSTADISGFSAAASAAAPVQSVAGRTGAVTLTTGDVSGYQSPPVTSVAGRTGAVTLTTSDVSGYTAPPVTSVAGRTGAVTIAAADVSGLGSLATQSSVAYSSLTGTPSTFAPTAHASTHQTGGADAVSSVVVTPSSLAADTNDWSIGTGDIFRVAGTAARNITGIAAGTSGQAILLVNVGSFALTLKHASTSSSAANRFTTPWAGDCILAASGGNAVLVYDSTSSTWRVL